MPSKSLKQHRLMQAVKHNAEFAEKVGIPQEVGEEFMNADKKAGKFQATAALGLIAGYAMDSEYVCAAVDPHGEAPYQPLDRLKLWLYSNGSSILKMEARAAALAILFAAISKALFKITDSLGRDHLADVTKGMSVLSLAATIGAGLSGVVLAILSVFSAAAAVRDENYNPKALEKSYKEAANFLELRNKFIMENPKIFPKAQREQQRRQYKFDMHMLKTSYDRIKSGIKAQEKAYDAAEIKAGRKAKYAL